MTEIELLQRKLEREKAARKEAEKIAEEKTREIFYINQDLMQLNDHLEEMVKERTAELTRARDEAIEASLIKSQFLANMSHELRTPLNAIIGYSEMLMEEAEEMEEVQFAHDLRKINDSGKHLLSLINDILDLAKIEAGKVDMYYELCDVPSLMNEVLVTIQPLSVKNRNTVIVDPIPDYTLNTDVTKLRQILLNLLSNASKFTSDGTIQVTVAAISEPGKTGILFKIKDTGIGMNKEQLTQIFKEFSQADASTTRKFGGTGLGLAITKRFCEMMGGTIEVESVYGAGSTFTVWMPELSGNPDSSFSSSGSDSRNSGQPTILVIDDDTSMQELMKYYLSKESWRIVYASSGKEGIRLAKELKPSMITLDILMPGMDGWSVLTTLKNDPEISGIPVMILSMTNDKHLSFALGASEFLTKPIQRDKLLPVLSKYLETPKSGTVLVIEDDITTGEMLTRMLEKEGYHPLNAGNGQIALDVMQTVTPQLILLDLMMPEMDGFEFVKQMRKRQEWSHIPVVVVTAKNITEEDRTRLNGSIANIIQKGAINREALLKEVRKLMTKQIQADL